MLALSVSISTSSSPADTSSPSDLSHLRIVPSSIESDRRGIATSAMAGVLPDRHALARRARPDDREVPEAGVEAGGLQDHPADLVHGGGIEQRRAPAAPAGRPAAAAGAERVAPGPMAEVHVADDPDRLERLQVAVD